MKKFLTNFSINFARNLHKFTCNDVSLRHTGRALENKTLQSDRTTNSP